MCIADSDYYASLLSAARERSGAPRRPVLGDGQELLESMRGELDALQVPPFGYFADQHLGQRAAGFFESLRKVQAHDVFAFKETWTDEDTEILRSLDDASGGFTDGLLTTENFRERLLSIKELDELIAKKRIAIVGGGRSLDSGKHGQEIDDHPVVARFNDMIGSKLNAQITGNKTTFHIMNNWISPPDEPNVFQMDLESTALQDSYCKRMNLHGQFAKHTGKMVLLRPSAYCGLEGLGHFTRGFIFYWLVGSLFETADLYGMGDEDSRFHAHGGTASTVAEPFLEFEHLLYRKAGELEEKLQAAVVALEKGADQRDDAHLVQFRATGATLPDEYNQGVAMKAAQFRTRKAPHLNMFPWPQQPERSRLSQDKH